MIKHDKNWRRLMAVAAMFALLALPCCTLAKAADDAHDADATSQHDGHAVADGHGGAGHAEEGPNPLALAPDLAVFTAIVFLVLLGVLTKFAWGPIVAALESREQGIADNISAAAAKNEEAKRLLADYEKRLSNTADEVRDLLEEARRDAEHTKGQIIAEAKSAAESEHERATRDVNNAKDAALQAIAEAGADMAVNLAGKIVKRELKADDHAQLIRDAVSRFPESSPSDN